MSTYRSWGWFSEGINVLHALIAWTSCVWLSRWLSAWTPAPKHHEFSSECHRQGGGAHLAVNKWQKLICRNSFTNHNQWLMCFGRWKQQKSVFRSRTGWTLSHLAQTCLQCPTNPLLSCLHYPHVHCTCTTDNTAMFGKQISDSPSSPPRDHIQHCFKTGFVSHWKVFSSKLLGK